MRKERQTEGGYPLLRCATFHKDTTSRGFLSIVFLSTQTCRVLIHRDTTRGGLPPFRCVFFHTDGDRNDKKGKPCRCSSSFYQPPPLHETQAGRFFPLSTCHQRPPLHETQDGSSPFDTTRQRGVYTLCVVPSPLTQLPVPLS
jgi:hypothetical protein